MKKTLVLLSISLLVLSCSEKKDDSGPKTINNLDQSYIDEESSVTKELDGLGVTYSGGRRKFSTSKLSLACDEKQMMALKKAEEKLSSIETSLAPLGEKYRESALDFFRKVQDEKKSLAEINALMIPYCEQDHKAISECIGGKAPVLLELNKNIGGHLVVHPVIVPNDAKDVGIYVTNKDDQEDDTYVRSMDIKSESELKHYAQELPKIATVERLDSIFKCISQVDQKSAVGQRIRVTSRTSFQLSRQECLILKAKIIEAQKEEERESINLRPYITDEQKTFCGPFLD